MSKARTIPARARRTTRPPETTSAPTTPAATGGMGSSGDQAEDLAALNRKVDHALELLTKLLASQAQTAATSTAALTVKQFAAESRLGTTTIYQLISDGTIASIKVGKRRLIPREELQKLLTVADRQT